MTDGIEVRPKSLLAQRISISSLFFFFGFTFASWASRIPDIQQHLQLSETKLGAVLLAMPVGSFITLPFSSYIASKIGSRKVVMVASFWYCLLLTAIGWTNSVFQLTVFLFLFGSAGNMVNISINTQALALEGLYKRTIISSFHGMWSVAGLFAATLGTYFMGRSVTVTSHFMFVTGLGVLSFIIAIPHLVKDEPVSQGKRPFFTRPDKAFIGLGLIAFCSMICQGAMFDWSGVYFKKVLATKAAYIGFGYTAFMISMTFIRFITDRLTFKFGFKKVIAACGLCTTVGLLITVFFPYLIPATFGLLLVGIGVSPGVPLVFSAAAKSKKLPAPAAIAAVASVGSIGQLIGPPIIGFIAGLTTLKMSFLILSIFGIAISVLAIRHREE